MGQQQLLLLVLSTVIVGLATVAGIQAFSENQQQATQDALVQRAITLGNDVLSAHREPNQLGGITLGGDDTSPSDIASAIGVSSASGIAADGAGESASCDISNGEDPTVECGSGGSTSGAVTVEVDVDPDAEEPVSVGNITVNS